MSVGTLWKWNASLVTSVLTYVSQPGASTPETNKQINKKVSTNERIEIADRNGSSVPSVCRSNEREKDGRKRDRGPWRKWDVVVPLGRINHHCRSLWLEETLDFTLASNWMGRRVTTTTRRMHREGERPTKGEDDSEAAGSLAKWPGIMAWASEKRSSTLYRRLFMRVHPANERIFRSFVKRERTQSLLRHPSLLYIYIYIQRVRWTRALLSLKTCRQFLVCALRAKLNTPAWSCFFLVHYSWRWIISSARKRWIKEKGYLFVPLASLKISNLYYHVYFKSRIVVFEIILLLEHRYSSVVICLA